MPNKSAYLEIILGPMFSGKTSKLLDIYRKCSFCNIPIAVLNHCADTRYHETMLSNHDKIMIPCIQTKTLNEVWNYTDLEAPFEKVAQNHLKLRSADVILINEAQFFDDLVSCVKDMLKEKKKVYVSGLDGDFQQKKFGTILELIPLCDKVSKLSSICGLCKNGTDGIFSMRLTNETTQMVIGSENYIPVCRNCLEKNNCCLKSS
jgi:thymidine kinase